MCRSSMVIEITSKKVKMEGLWHLKLQVLLSCTGRLEIMKVAKS